MPRVSNVRYVFRTIASLILAASSGSVLADEPTGNLDSATAQTIIELLANLAHQQNYCVVVTHNLEIVDMVDVTYQMRDGVLIHSS